MNISLPINIYYKNKIIFYHKSEMTIMMLSKLCYNIILINKDCNKKSFKSLFR